MATQYENHYPRQHDPSQHKSQDAAPSDAAPSASAITAQQLRFRYILALSIIAILTLAAQFVIQVTLKTQDFDSRVINLAGRQRMLSQNIIKTCLYLLTDQSEEKRFEYRIQLEEGLKMWSISHQGLRAGSAELELPGENSDEIKNLFNQIEAPYLAIKQDVLTILRSDLDDLAVMKSVIPRIKINEAVFLDGMNKIVFQYDKEAHERVFFSKVLEATLALITLLALVLEANFIFAPAVRTIKNSIESLELQRQDLVMNNLDQEAVIERLPIGMNIVDLEGNILYLNEMHRSVFGGSAIGKKCWEVYKDDKKQCESCSLGDAFRHGESRTSEVEGVMGGKTFEITHTFMTLNGKKVALETFKNVSVQKELELGLQKSLKMESVGRLAGGIAHYFNNMLAAIIINAELIARDPSHRQVAMLNEHILKACNRSKAIISQLLAFARKDIAFPKLLDLNLLISKENILSNLLPNFSTQEKAKISFEFRLADNLWSVRMDPSHFEQVFTNLVRNAIDAMPTGGQCVIETQNVKLDKEDAKAKIGFFAGEYVKLSVRDSGHGMAESTMANIFEPFFTTKALGDGVGLGLATVYGIVAKNGGFIDVKSVIAKGSEFDIYFPRYNLENSKRQILTNQSLPKGRSVLVMDGEELRREATKRFIESLGHEVIVAEDPQIAMNDIKDSLKIVDLAIIDTNLPGMDGRAAFELIRRIRPKIKVLFVLSYSELPMVNQQIAAEGFPFLVKPVELSSLQAKLTKIFGSEG